MERVFNHYVFLVFTISILHLICGSEQMQSSQSHTLLRVKHLLNFPVILNEWNKNTDFCNSEPNPSLIVACYEGSITQLHITGEKGALQLPQNFSIDSLFRTIARLSDLRVLTLVSLGIYGPLPRAIELLSSIEILNMSSNFLSGGIPQEIASLSSLQTLILDDNILAGRLPDWLSSLPTLTVLSLKNNSFDGSLPISFGYVKNLRVLVLSHNDLYGEVPDFSHLINLQILELDNNAFGPKFPQLGNKVVKLSLSRNRFRSHFPSEVESYYQLERLDLSFNSFVGPFPESLLSLPSINYIDVKANKFSGMLFGNQTCNPDLEFVDFSSNLLIGNIPNCLLENSKRRVVLYAKNCLSTPKQSQYPLQHCQNEALAVTKFLGKNKQKRVSKAVIAFVITGCLFGSFAIVGSILIIRRRLNPKATDKYSTRSITENASTGTRYDSRLLFKTGFISQTLNTVGLPGYRTFSFDELKEATNNFDTSAFMGEGFDWQMYRGLLKDGSHVAIRCKIMKRIHETQNLMQLISKLRHRHLVSALGHCFECSTDDYSVRRIFLVFEYVPNGSTLRSWISEEHCDRPFSWTKRISAAIGIAKGIQFLHTGLSPALYRNNLKITDILVDCSFTSKITSYNLPLLANTTGKVELGILSSGSKDHVVDARVDGFKTDVYDFGVILLELIKGRQVKSEKQVDLLIDQIKLAVGADKKTRQSLVDPIVNKTCLDESLKTVMEICGRCLQTNLEERPSLEDILWNLNYAAQVQDAWRRESHN